ncbi:hypothetical protein LGH70_04490 [Hymenobacter sp. BT635]|uniref:Poly-beta-1,6-N-acetyl-D-glucosamine biosynthesis protein PgaD n=1 Tax=Hymenobacter nitidus TaxID=2880929 RepID=A0ABS8A8V4_9BACT|nr:hypothetical protein [Hymenobacter nitidus]MCB2376825.1 hypothetical protein [Hymenobacter nitidus]
MIEGLFIVLFWLLALLFIVVLGLVQYVLIPWGLLRAFFRSEWAPQVLKDAVAWTLGILVLLLVGFLGWNWHRQWQARQLAAAQQRWPHVFLTAQQPGFLPFPLGRGRIEQARYDQAPLLVVAGDLVVEGRLRAYFTASPGLKFLHETNIVRVSTEKGDATQATGQSVYDPGSRTVSGSFHCVLPSGKQLSISFPSTPITVQ